MRPDKGGIEDRCQGEGSQLGAEQHYADLLISNAFHMSMSKPLSCMPLPLAQSMASKLVDTDFLVNDKRLRKIRSGSVAGKNGKNSLRFFVTSVRRSRLFSGVFNIVV